MTASEKELREVQTAHGTLKFWFDWECDGAIKMENPRTIERYEELRHTHPDLSNRGVFVAFSAKQFNEGYDSLVSRGFIKNGDKVIDAGFGIYGTSDELDSFFGEYEKLSSQVKEECDPQEVYFWEYNNHECMISWDGDKGAIEEVQNIWGKEVIKNLLRFNKACDD